MKLIIDIDEREYNIALKRKENFPRDLSRFESIIANGEPYQEWISCSERLPEKGGDYLVTNVFDIGDKEPVREVNKDYYCYHSKKWLYEDKNIIAWQPLPESYNAESEE